MRCRQKLRLKYKMRSPQKRVAIVQSNFLPWRGYYHLISYVDVMVILDSVQFTKRDWRNRNKIKTPDGVKWLTVPVDTKGSYYQKIREVRLSQDKWREKIVKTIELSYRRSSYFEKYIECFKGIILDDSICFLSDLNLKLLKEVLRILDIRTPIEMDHGFDHITDASEKLASLTQYFNGDVYVSGPSAQNYLDEGVFEKIQIGVEWFNYPSYVQYDQLWGPYEGNLSILDLIFNKGPEAKNILALADYG